MFISKETEKKKKKKSKNYVLRNEYKQAKAKYEL